MDTKKLRQKILDLAIRGKLVPQDPNDEPASVLLERIRAEKERLIAEGKIKRSRKSKTSSSESHYQNFEPPFEIPDSWEWVKLGEIGLWQSGATPSKSNPNYFGKGYPWLNTGDLNDGYISLIPKEITPFALKETSVKLNPAGSVLIAMYGATIGKLGILNIDATTNQACCACYKYWINQKYLFFFLLAWRPQFIQMGGGGAQPNISKEKIEETYIPCPPANEQLRIERQIEFIFELLNKVDVSKNDIEKTVVKTKSKILELALQGKLVPQDSADEPAADMLRRINPKAKIITDNPHYPKLPDNWVYVTLEDIVDYEQPQPYMVTDTSYSDDYATPVLTAGKSFILGYTNETNGIYSKLPVIIFDDFTTDSRIIDFPFKVKSSAMKILSVKEGINIEYVAAFISITRLTGDTHKRYWISEYSKLLIPLPPIAEQTRIIEAIRIFTSNLESIQRYLN